VVKNPQQEEKDFGEHTDFQVATGVKLKLPCCLTEVFVFASIWPSWALAAEACGFKKIGVHVEDVAKATRTSLETRSCSRWMEREEWYRAVEEATEKAKNKLVVILVQGPEKVVSKVKKRIGWTGPSGGASTQFVMIAGFTDGMPNLVKFEGRDRDDGVKRRRRHSDAITDKTFQIGHAMVGGILDHSWSFWCNHAIEPPARERLKVQTPVQAKLLDYLSQTERGTEIKEGKVSDKIPWKRRMIQVSSPCVFATTKWVRRQISGKEMGVIYDLPGSWLREQASWEEKTTRDFTQQIPTRVLIRSLEVLVLPRLGQDGKELEVQGREGNVRKACRESQENKEISDLERHLLDERPHVQDSIATEEKVSSKNDDAEIRFDEWNGRAMGSIGITYRSEAHDEALDVLRRAMFQRYCSFRHGPIGSFRRFMKQEYGAEWLKELRKVRKEGGNAELIRSYDVGIDAIRRAIGGTFWEWSKGSTVFFWRWPRDMWKELRDGARVWYRKRALPQYWGRQQWPIEEKEKGQLREKVSKVVERGYVVEGYVKSLTSFFAVPKGHGDI
jgi:hypothetical protein